MTHDQKLITIRAMKAHGGSFVRALAEALLFADSDNQAKIEQAFPNYMAKYGPGSAMFDATKRVEGGNHLALLIGNHPPIAPL